jgi:hypothetical protein
MAAPSNGQVWYRVWWIAEANQDQQYYADFKGQTSAFLAESFSDRKDADDYAREIAKNPKIQKTWVTLEISPSP